jgi:hypothetical protein
MWTICWIKQKFKMIILWTIVDSIMTWFEIKCELRIAVKTAKKNKRKKRLCIHIKPLTGIYSLVKVRFDRLIFILEKTFSKSKQIVFWAILAMVINFWIHQTLVLELLGRNWCRQTKKRWFPTNLELIVPINKKWIPL